MNSKTKWTIIASAVILAVFLVFVMASIHGTKKKEEAPAVSKDQVTMTQSEAEDETAGDSSAAQKNTTGSEQAGSNGSKDGVSGSDKEGSNKSSTDSTKAGKKSKKSKGSQAAVEYDSGDGNSLD